MNRKYEKYDDIVLIDLLVQNDEIAFIEIYTRYWDKMYNVACNKLNEYYIAQEIVQNIFISLWERRYTLNLKTPLNIYLAAALKYQVINARQKKVRENNYVKYMTQNSSHADLNSTEHHLSFKELQDRLTSVVTSLPTQCQLVYKLKKEEGLTAKEIAQKLGITEKAVESNFTRAIKRIKNSLKDTHHFFHNYLVKILLREEC
ncbi:RNA polymerase sigma factor [Rhizosphaericola mali]|uniref:Sigma-70 family RNA polymerase sigma factor n=1 Tax=Rhizosphaericola mali TaxID=2545455 RepID=A0A5P2G4E4_9BACT|nr:sigma-70 family RNA polymerase sigma factor [Rhizosphaericola mali]QES89019.1 sigma-70 family RNA polymerase sigma factor [Rhizosphaericola mali]